MKIYSCVFSGLFSAAALVGLVPGALAQTAAPAACPAILQHEFLRLQDEAPQNLCQYAGKAVLVVNTASYCGFTSQYEGLEALYAKYQSKGLVVLGFPSNDFGKQEPGSSKEIADFCFNTYGVKFPMFSKAVVVGPKRNALYESLFQATKVAPGWNFHKYLIGRDGKVLASFASQVAPDNVNVVTAIEKALNQKPEPWPAGKTRPLPFARRLRVKVAHPGDKDDRGTVARSPARRT
jgi:glutathione peroxidase